MSRDWPHSPLLLHWKAPQHASTISLALALNEKVSDAT